LVWGLDVGLGSVGRHVLVVRRRSGSSVLTQSTVLNAQASRFDGEVAKE
jgi:hypothetical protein